MKSGSILDKQFIKSKEEIYIDLEPLADRLLHDESDPIANMANFSSFLYHNLEDINWAGFYILHGEQLVLGPFQGKPACIRIRLGKGVCGKAAESRSPLIVRDVNTFPGHIACDPDSRSEIVLPVQTEDRLFGVLDIDSPRPARFDDIDLQGLRKLVEIFIRKTNL